MTPSETPMTKILLAGLTATLLSVHGCAQVDRTPKSRKEQAVLPADLCYSKGGLGLIRKRLFIVVKSAKNQLMLPDGAIWTGKPAGTNEVVMIFDDKVWSPAELPPGFDLRKTVIVSFQGDIIRFFEFDSNSGGYYMRIPVE